MNNIYSVLNRQYSLDDYCVLGEVKNEEQRESLESSGYHVGFTAASWKQRFPQINPDRVICQKTILFPNTLYYYDPIGCICFPLQIYGGQVFLPSHADDSGFEEFVLKQIRVMETARVRKEYIKLLAPIASEGSGRMAMTLLAGLLKNEKPSPELYKAFMHYYTFVDCGAKELYASGVFDRLWLCKSDGQKRHTARAMRELPEMLTVYRGEGSESTDYREAFSWTLDINKAYFFASWRGGEKARIVKAQVRKADVVEYLTDRNESEILVFPGEIDHSSVSVMQCVTWEDFLNVVGSKKKSARDGYGNFDLNAYSSTSLLAKMNQIYDDLNRDNIADHDRKHSIRVALMASYLYRKDILPKYRRSGMIQKEQVFSVYVELMDAAAWHDAGRTHSSVSREHGARSYDLYRNEMGEDPVAEFLMSFHCRPDCEARAYWNSALARSRRIDPEESNLVWSAFLILKDADALDRWRFGALSEDFVRVEQLRTETAKRLMPIAALLQGARL